MAGWVKIHRQIQDNAIWMSDEPFDSRSAWIDLILMANHEDKEVYQGGQFFKIKILTRPYPQHHLYTPVFKQRELFKNIIIPFMSDGNVHTL